MKRAKNQPESINAESIIDLIETCQAQPDTVGILRAASRLIQVAFGAEIIAYTMTDKDDACEVFISSTREIGDEAELLIKTQLSALLSEIHRRDVPTHLIEPIHITPMGTRQGLAEIPRILWSVDIGPAGHGQGSLAVFGNDREQLDERALIGLRGIGRVLGVALDHTLSPNDVMDTMPTPGIIQFRINHIESIREAFGPHRTNRLKVDIAQRIVEALPRGSAVARIHENGITAIISDPSIDLVEVQRDCLRACRGLEIDERILVRIDSHAASSAPAQGTQVDAMTVSTPVIDTAESAVGDHTH